MEQEFISLANAIKELSVYRDSKEEALIEITHHIRRKNLSAYATSRGWIIIEKFDKRGNGNYYIETNESYSIEGFITPCELPLLEVARSIHLIREQFDDVFKLSSMNINQSQHNDLGLHIDQRIKPPRKRSSPKAVWILAIELVIEKHGNKLTNRQILDNLKSECLTKKDESPYSDIEVESINYDNDDAVVAYYDKKANCKTVTKKTLQNRISEILTTLN